MSKELNIGDYVRQKRGHIYRIKNKGELEAQQYRNEANDKENEGFIAIKSSPNIIDLIEVGDYVNGVEVIDLADGIHLEFANNVSYVDVGLATYRDGHVEGIETIVTKEQFESMEYKVE